MFRVHYRISLRTEETDTFEALLSSAAPGPLDQLALKILRKPHKISPTERVRVYLVCGVNPGLQLTGRIDPELSEDMLAEARSISDFLQTLLDEPLALVATSYAVTK